MGRHILMVFLPIFILKQILLVDCADEVENQRSFRDSLCDGERYELGHGFIPFFTECNQQIIDKDLPYREYNWLFYACIIRKSLGETELTATTYFDLMTKNLTEKQLAILTYLNLTLESSTATEINLMSTLPTDNPEESTWSDGGLQEGEDNLAMETESEETSTVPMDSAEELPETNPGHPEAISTVQPPEMESHTGDDNEGDQWKSNPDRTGEARTTIKVEVSAPTPITMLIQEIRDVREMSETGDDDVRYATLLKKLWKLYFDAEFESCEYKDCVDKARNYSEPFFFCSSFQTRILFPNLYTEQQNSDCVQSWSSNLTLFSFNHAKGYAESICYVEGAGILDPQKFYSKSINFLNLYRKLVAGFLPASIRRQLFGEFRLIVRKREGIVLDQQKPFNTFAEKVFTKFNLKRWAKRVKPVYKKQKRVILNTFPVMTMIRSLNRAQKSLCKKST